MKAKCLVAAMAAVSFMAAAGDALNPGWVALDTVSGNLALELKLGNRLGTNEIFYAGLWNAGANNNVLDVIDFQASATGVTPVMSSLNVDSGALFALGDWCIGANYAALPYINDFNVNVLRYNLGTGTVSTLQIPASTTDQYTSTDCLTLNGGTDFVIGANNFDQKKLDYFRSQDDGLNWNLQLSYSIAPDTIIDAFAGGVRDTHGSIIDQLIGSVYQRGNGDLEAVTLNPDNGDVLGLLLLARHVGLIGNGYLKEMDGVQSEDQFFGVVNGGTANVLGRIDTSVSFEFTLTNGIESGSVLGFQGVTLEPMPVADGFAVHTFNSRHFWTDYRVVGGFQMPQVVSGYPFENNGGPVDSTSISMLNRIYVAAIYQGGNRGTGGPVTAIATLDPAAVVVGGTGGGTAAVPALGRGMLVLFGVLLLIAGGFALKRRSGIVQRL